MSMFSRRLTTLAIALLVGIGLLLAGLFILLGRSAARQVRPPSHPAFRGRVLWDEDVDSGAALRGGRKSTPSAIAGGRW